MRDLTDAFVGGAAAGNTDLATAAKLRSPLSIGPRPPQSCLKFSLMLLNNINYFRQNYVRFGNQPLSRAFPTRPEMRITDMRTVFSIAALLMALSAGTAGAQQSPPDATPPAPPTTASAPKADAPPPPPPGPQGGPAEDQLHADWRHGPMGHRPPPPPPPSKAAHFRIETGDIKIDIKCAEDEPTKACADEVNQILDRLQGSSSHDDDDR